MAQRAIGPWAGRGGRKEYWLLVLLIWAASIALSFLPGSHGGGGVLIVAWSIPYFRRLHDLGRSGWWSLLALLAAFVPVILAVALGGGAILFQIAGASKAMSEQDMLWNMVGVFGTLAVELAFTIWLGVQKGDPGDNRFGPPPRKRAAAA